MRWIVIILIIYISICLLLYFIQEHLIFFPDKTPTDYKYHFDGPFEEVYIRASDDTDVHGILFKASNARGLIFYLHGNAGSLESWGDIAGIYTNLGYDLFMLDYRGYGKSGGRITSEKKLHEDARLAFDKIVSRYRGQYIVVLGYSLGTAIAAKIAAESKADMLILQSPYYSMTDVMKRLYKIIPPVILRYKLDTWKYVKECNVPIVILHGTHDEVIDYQSAVKLKQHLKPTDTFITIDGLGHNGMSHHPQYLEALPKILP